MTLRTNELLHGKTCGERPAVYTGSNTGAEPRNFQGSGDTARPNFWDLGIRPRDMI